MAGERQGSSPLARGTLHGFLIYFNNNGLIPARAGNTWFPIRRYPTFGAHPRSRGEHPTNAGGIRTDQGSSPLARGTLGRVPAHLPYAGLIPARAGNTCGFPPPRSPAGAHPRSRGEHSGFVHGTTVEPGSSPLARGTHLLTWDFTPYISKIESLWNQSLHPEYTISSHY